VFEGLKPNGFSRIFLASAEGGTPKELFEEGHKQGEPSWSPDGRSVAFSRFDDSAGPETPSVSIQVFNLATNQASTLPGSAGLRSPAWSPKGQFIAAVTEDLHKLMLLDLKTQKLTELANATLLNGELTWSNDGKDLYYQDLLGANQPIYQIRLSDHKRELVTSFETVLHSGIHRAALSGQAPDGSLIARLDRGFADIYALDLELH
jgi:Tol biopolymer transport system component